MTNIANLTPKKSQTSPPPGGAPGSPLDTVSFDEELVDAIVTRRATMGGSSQVD
jgi:hypothetical protein